MGIGVLILGASGTGKSASLRNFKSDEISIINVNGKPLPFKNNFKKIIVSDNSETIIKAMSRCTSKVIVIDDSQYIMANEYMKKSLERGFDKYSIMARNFWNIIYKVKELPSDVIVYFLHHSEETETGFIKAKTQGKVIDSHITLEGMFSVVLRTFVNQGRYGFYTQNSGSDTVKTPMGLFSSLEIDNDLKAIDTSLRDYYNLTKLQ